MEAAREERRVAGISTAGQSLFSRRIDFHPARKSYTGVPLSSGDFCLEILNPSSSAEGRVASVSGVEPSTAEMGKKSTLGAFHEHGLDSELSFRINFQRIGAGLENLGNTCYLNSVLQCLTYTEPFAAYLQSGKHKSTCRAAGFCAMCALQNHVMDALQSTGKILRPFHLVRNLRCISRSFRNSRQEDAHEYMVNLLESMHKCCLPSGVPSESPSAYEKSLVHKIFGGQLRSQVKCMQCSYCSDKFDPFLDLSLEIVKADSLKKAFLHFTAMEQLDGGARQYQCLHCKEKVQAYKQLTIHKAPYVLSIHLKRFGSSINGEKINKKVEFEPTLNLKPFFSGAHEGELKYTLYGVLVHAGCTTHSGHYFCYVRTSAGLWYSLDDNHVSQVSEKIVLSREAYMLFYVRDRTSAMKQVPVNLNANISASSTGNKEASLVERKLNNAVFNSTKAINDAIIHDRSVSVMNNTKQLLFKNQQPLVQYDDNTSTKDSYSQINGGGVPSNGLHKTVLPTKKTELKSQLPSQSKIENVKQTSLEYATQQKVETNCAPSGNDNKRSLSQSNAINRPIKEAKRAKFMEHQANDPYIKDCSIYSQNHEDRENLPNFLAAKPSESLKPNKQISTIRDETSAVSEIGDFLNGDIHQTRVMSKKRKVHLLLAENSYNWRKQLFFMSLRLHNKTKKNKTKKHGQILRNKMKKMIDLWTADSEGASTSETFRTCAVDSTSRKKFKREKIVKAGNDYSQMSDKESDRSRMTAHKPGTLKRTRSLECIKEQQNVKIQNAEDEENHLMESFLRESLRETTVARWDAEELATPPRNDLEDTSKRTIGYLLDEWDEEYDRGKRKKRKSRQWFNGPTNPFQETANFKAQEKMVKVVQTSFGKEPFRI